MPLSVHPELSVPNRHLFALEETVGPDEVDHHLELDAGHLVCGENCIVLAHYSFPLEVFDVINPDNDANRDEDERRGHTYGENGAEVGSLGVGDDRFNVDNRGLDGQ